MHNSPLSWPSLASFAPSGAEILLVEDDPGVSAALSLSLEARGHRVTTAGSSEEADERLSRSRFDLVLLDIDLPRMSGIQFLEWAMVQWPVLPIIMLTGRDSQETALHCLRAGARGYLTKPADPELLDHVVRDTLATKRLLSEWNERAITSESFSNA